MIKVETKKSYEFEELTALQPGWNFTASQLGRSKGKSIVSLCQTTQVRCSWFRYGTAYDQKISAKEGVVNFGLLDLDSPATWAHDQVIPNHALVVFTRDEAMGVASPVGCCGNSMSFSEAFMEDLAEQVYQQPLNFLLSGTGIYGANAVAVQALRAELKKWQLLVAKHTDTRPDLVSRREESLALAIFDLIVGARPIEISTSQKSTLAVSRALDLIHHSELDTISAAELCKHTDCSQRTLETNFLKRFGVTPKKYIKLLRLARVHRGLQHFDTQDCESIIELAGAHGFWHMGQLAADYRAIYGELPSATLARN